MTTLTVNGREITKSITPRTHLADFLRESQNLTGTHLGCEHGVCGACTILIDGSPARSCITFAAMCEGADIITIEGLEDDLAVTRLRAAFTAEHALQCGFCTPGMLVTARDIVHRLPDADDDRIRLELAGNLCRCTGYNGIVRAIRRVLDERLNFAPQKPAGLGQQKFATGTVQANPTPPAAPAGLAGKSLQQKLRLAVPVKTAWEAVRNPGLIASCVPGVTLTSAEPDHLTGEMAASFGPITARFTGTGNITYGDYTGTINAQGMDAASNTRLTAEAIFRVSGEGEQSVIWIDIKYALRGPLAQLARPPIVNLFAVEILGQVAANLEARLLGGDVSPPKKLSLVALLGAVVQNWLRRLFSGAGS